MPFNPSIKRTQCFQPLQCYVCSIAMDYRTVAHSSANLPINTLLTVTPNVPSRPPPLPVSLQLISDSLDLSVLNILLKMESNKHYVWLVSVSMFSRFLCFVPCISASFLSLTINILLCGHNTFVYSFTS